MLIAPVPVDEEARLAELRSLEILDTDREERFDRLTRLASRLFGTPIALISLVDADRQWFKSAVGLDERETSRDVSFCAHAIVGRDGFVVPDTATDARFADNPLVTGEPHIRFYAGQPITGPEGHRLGTLCVIDREPRTFSDEDRQLLRDLATIVDRELAGRTLAETLRDLRATEARFEASFQRAPIGMAMVSLRDDNFGLLIDVNDSLVELVGDDRTTAIGASFVDYVHPDDVEPVAESARAAARGEIDRLDRELRLVRPDQSTIWVRIRAAAVRDEHGTNAYGVVHVADVTERRKFEAELERLALHDPLTGLPNRRLLADRLSHALRALEREPAPVAVMYLDLDHFKHVNDTYGHDAGDELIKVAADRLDASVRPIDTAGRIGGDEFVLVCPRLGGADDALGIAKRVRQAFLEPIDVGPASVVLTISGGIALTSDPGAEPDHLLRSADQALYRAKRAGRDRFEIADAGDALG
jgi:diguanylate cyclase (GGDEF)-like protein/PAS domain S-box-containing protein